MSLNSEFLDPPSISGSMQRGGALTKALQILGRMTYV